jgi:predicted flap endonuclease-1-like 5' DNA nuclease
MDAKSSPDEANENDLERNGQMATGHESKLERVLSFWGSYCFADVSSWTEEEIQRLSKSIETTPESGRRKQQIDRVHRAAGGYPEDEK